MEIYATNWLFSKLPPSSNGIWSKFYSDIAILSENNFYRIGRKNEIKRVHINFTNKEFKNVDKLIVRKYIMTM